MGCTSSKVDSEDTVRRCRDRRRLMKEAVHSRHHLAAAHSDYLRSLRLTGFALSAFASFQSHLSVSPDLAPTVLLPHLLSADRREYQHQYQYQHQHQHQHQHLSSPPRAAAAPAVQGGEALRCKVATNEHPAGRISQHQPPPPATKQFKAVPPSPSITSSKVPHILSESSPTSTPEISEGRGKNSKRGAYRKFPYLSENVTYATTPSQASSAWDWEKFYPPSPPGSEYFDRLQKERDREEHGVAGSDDGHHLPDVRDSDVEDDGSDDDGHGKLYYREEHQEEVQCSDWRDRCSTSSSSSLKSGGGGGHGDDLEEDDDGDARSEVISAPKSDLGSSSMDRHRHPHFPHHIGRGPPSEFGSSSATGLSGRKGATAMSTSSSEGPESSIRHERGAPAGDHSVLKMVVRHRDLKEIVAAIEEYFAKAAAAGEGVSDLLETGRAQFEGSFRQLKKTVYHSNSVLSNLSASWTSRPPLAIRYRLDTAALEVPAAAGDGGKGSHCSALERLLTWEKKLYKEVKKEAVHSRHHLAAAHSDYLRSLRLTGSALSAFASFQSHLSVSPDLAPTVLLPRVLSADRREYQHQYQYQHPSSPPRAAAAAPAVHTAAVPPPAAKQFKRVPPSPSITSSKVPHILSESSPTSTPEIYEGRGKNSKRGAYRKFPYLSENITYATTPSQASSAWDWEKFYPPSPPGSEYFDRLQKEREREEHGVAGSDDGHHLPDVRDSDVEDDGSDDGHGKLHRREEHQEEVQCSDWRDRCSTSSSSSLKSGGGSGHGDDLEDDDGDARSEVISAPRSDLGSSSMDRHRHPHFPHHIGRGPPSEFGSSSATGLSGRKGATAMSTSSSEGPESTIRHERGAPADDHSVLKMVVRHRDLKEIVAAIEEYFAKAAAAGEGVSDLLETGRAQFEGSFRQLKKTVYHSNSVLSNLSASWTSRPPLAIRYRLDTAALEVPAAAGDGGKGSHCSALERLLTWEKKLYKEVKDREGIKIEHEKKLSTLQSLERRGRVDEKLDKTKASITKLHSHIMVTSQAVSTTSSAIIKVRDNELAPQLLKLCFGFMSMWRSMNELHEVQNQIVQQVRGLVNHAAAVESTSDLLRQTTRDLESAISAWHSSFTRIIKHQREYVRSLYGWLKLTLIQVSNDNNSEKDHYSSLVSTELCAFCDEWKQALERLPDTVASEAIKSFVNVVHTISVKQAEELKIRKRAESYSKELEKKTLSLRSIEKKYYQSYSMVGIGLPDGAADSNGQVLDMRDPLADKKTEIQACRRKVEEEMVRHINAIKVTREMTLNSIQTGLPGVFQAMTSFSGLFAEALEGVCRRAGPLS